MSSATTDISELKVLPCFNHIINISAISSGLSHSCFKIVTQHSIFFAKKLNVETNQTELYCSKFSANYGLSPAIIYTDKNWLVTEFINGTTLDKTDQSPNTKINIAISLMVKLHKLPALNNPADIPCLNIKGLLSDLLSKTTHLNGSKHQTLDNIANILTNTINRNQEHLCSPNVLCHGDINYSNIMLSSNLNRNLNDSFNGSNEVFESESLLLDFECAQLAPVEFDIAMFITVNNIPFEHVNEIISNYLQSTEITSIDNRLLTYLILFCFLINALWYHANSNNPLTKNKFSDLLTKQCLGFDNYVTQFTIKLPKLAPLLT